MMIRPALLSPPRVFRGVAYSWVVLTGHT